jgi:hypothetical protein
VICLGATLRERSFWLFCVVGVIVLCDVKGGMRSALVQEWVLGMFCFLVVYVND